MCIYILNNKLIAGALVSAGFEVSATVVSKDIGPTSYIPQDSLERHSLRSTEVKTTEILDRKSDHLMESMVDWLENVPENELYV